MKKVFITGAEGFIGSHLVEKLVKENFKVTAMVRYNFSNNIGWLNDLDNRTLRKVKIVKGDITDYAFIEDATKNADAILNLAALIGIPYSYKAVKSYIDTNVIGTYNILKASQKNKIKKIIHTSTSEVYGGMNKKKINEKFINYAQSPYAASKIAADQLCISFFCSYNSPVVILRPFNTFGPRQSDRAIIPTVINQLIKRKNLSLGNINTFRDINYVEDTTNAYIKILKSNKNLYGEIFNVGSGFNFSIKKIVEILIKISGKKVKIKVEKARLRPKNSEVYHLLANNNKIKKIVGWKPKYDNYLKITKALENTYKWFEKNQNKYNQERKFVE